MRLVAVACTIIALSGSAAAAPFGGFSADESTYLRGRTSICVPLALSPPDAAGESPRATGVAACRDADASVVAAAKFRLGSIQRGADAQYEASARGTTLTVRSRRDRQVITTWETTDAIDRVTAAYLSPNGRIIAVAYEARLGGRVVEAVIGFALVADAARDTGGAAAGDAAAGDAAGGKADGGKAAKDGTLAVDQSADVTKAVAQARKVDGQAKQAEAAWAAVLALDAEHAEARYRRARALIRLRQQGAALTALDALAKSARADAIVWLVEARFDAAFAAVRGNQQFRAATGLARADRAQRGLYERLLGFSTQWEQHEIRCERERAQLDMKRLERTFTMRISSRCQGATYSTKLSGRFLLHGADELRLVLPNAKSDAEAVSCRLSVCPDSADEDCLRCAVDEDLDLTLRVVRR